MELKNIIQDLMAFRTETGNIVEIKKCIAYIMGLFENVRPRMTLYEKNNLAPVLLLSNTDSQQFDVLVVGHIDVVPADGYMFKPKMENGKLYGRGALDMKSFAAVGLESLRYVIEKKLPLKFGVLLSTDEEKGSFGLDAFLKDNSDLSAKVVLDVDVAGDIGKIISKCKSPVFVKIGLVGKEAHGSTPWEGIDANEKLLMVLSKIRSFYPYYSKELPAPENKWIDTVHFAKIAGGDVANVISNHAEALLDFRLTEKSTIADLRETLDKCMVDGATYTIVSHGTPVVMDENNQVIQKYKETVEEVLGYKTEFEYMGGATDSRLFADKGSVVIMHSGSGYGMHAKEEYVDFESVEQLAKIQKLFLDRHLL